MTNWKLPNRKLPIVLSFLNPTFQPFPIHPVDRRLGLFQFFFPDDSVAVALNGQHFVYDVFDSGFGDPVEIAQHPGGGIVSVQLAVGQLPAEIIGVSLIF